MRSPAVVILAAPGGFGRTVQSGRPAAVLTALLGMSGLSVRPYALPLAPKYGRVARGAVRSLTRDAVALQDRTLRHCRRNGELIAREADACEADVVISTTSAIAMPTSSSVLTAAWPDTTVFSLGTAVTAGVYPRFTAAALSRMERIEARCLASMSAVGLPTERAAAQVPPMEATRVIRAPFGANLAPEFLALVRGQREWGAGRPSGALEVLLLAVEWARKGGDLAVATVDHLRAGGVDARLTVVGMDDPGIAKPYVRFTGRLNQERAADREVLLEVMARTDCLIFPSRFDAYGAAVADCLTAGIPVVVSAFAGVSEYVRAGDPAVVIDAGSFGDVGAWASAVTSVARAPVSTEDLVDLRARFDYRNGASRLLAALGIDVP